MENEKFAQIFLELASLLELAEDNPFKIRAYGKAAQSIESFSGSIEDIYKKGGLKALQEIPGVGQHIAEKIEEYILTNKVSAREKLLKQFPPKFLELLTIQGMGPKTAVMLRKKIGIDSVDKLAKAAKAGKLKGLAGMGEKKEQNILRGIELKEKSRGRFLLSEATDYAHALVEWLQKVKDIDKIMPAGSLRRGCETVGDLDILVTAKSSKKIMDHFVKFPEVAEVLAKGETKSSVVLKNGMQADIRVVPPASFGAAAHYFTGSKQHNIHLRELGVKKGLKVNEYGIFKGKNKIAGKTEEEMFKTFGFPFIPPELRENRGEWEAAQKNKLPKLIELKDIKGDLHIHSPATDGTDPIEKIAKVAKKLGYEYIAITDHTESTRVAGGLTEKEMLKHFEEIDKINSKIKGITILKGAEVDILPDGTLDYSNEVLKEMDIVLAAVHSRFKMPEKEMTDRICKALKNKYVKILTHPTGRLIGEREPYAVNLEKVLKVAADTGTHIELNANPHRLDLNDIYCHKAKELGVKVVIATDAHNADSLYLMYFGVITARRGWLEKKDVLNTLPLKNLLNLL
ncbi:MAG: DNA polymerase/3'-5' exonuclease PolX [Candidatus Margulisbacteria bacterium]|nr:DNA polymerase/3'-5' exonuclease PolX [Candidatus Margulisiibacteriota bacterium]MBU1022290.1 DNA polymerase/3'-5' exonuclease PolX [Candidatus Margulisiibacteriota bacterium]MBU1729903.1 DNA polymerase/3'-5' exonuclease PolX [Candidatus Margulisiibacteriota bacterium]MBU1955937.1 DNA polymerase/3'-5' exonuclease PolX [Candidatus Margulisiibacteriota bacterium]